MILLSALTCELLIKYPTYSSLVLLAMSYISCVFGLRYSVFLGVQAGDLGEVSGALEAVGCSPTDVAEIWKVRRSDHVFP